MVKRHNDKIFKKIDIYRFVIGAGIFALVEINKIFHFNETSNDNEIIRFKT